MLRKLVAVAAFLPLAACASIMHGTSQGVGISSNPTNAVVTVDGKDMGHTPVVASLSRKDNHIIKLQLDGYQPYETTLTRGTSGWVWGNIVFGGIPGLAIDAISGGLYKLTPEQVAGQMGVKTATLQKDGIYVVVVLTPEAGWQKVGTLTPVATGAAVGE